MAGNKHWLSPLTVDRGGGGGLAQERDLLAGYSALRATFSGSFMG